MLAEAKILIRSAPWALRWRTSARSESGPTRGSASGSNEVKIRGPGSPCVAIQSPRSASARDAAAHDEDVHVVLHAAAAVEHGRGAENSAGARRILGREQPGQSHEHQNH